MFKVALNTNIRLFDNKCCQAYAIVYKPNEKKEAKTKFLSLQYRIAKCEWAMNKNAEKVCCTEIIWQLVNWLVQAIEPN